MRSSQVHIDSPCHESWEAMYGDEERRFCGVCQKHVHNLSAMRHDDARALLRERGGEHLCVRYTAEDDGTLRFRDLVPLAALTRNMLRTAFAATMLVACTPHGDGPPVQDLGDALIESQRGNVVATPDGGCNYTTGPFTTFHLPPGHVLCSNAGPAEPNVVQPIDPSLVSPSLPGPPEPPFAAMGAIEPVDPPDPPPVVDPIPPPQAIDPVPRATMGEAVAIPEAKDPFVPCDPKPGYAPPPPPDAPETHVKMGDVAAPPVVKPPPHEGRKTMGKPIVRHDDDGPY